MDQALIDQYEQGGEVLRQAVTGLSREDLQAFPVPGTWSIQQIVLHISDTELVLADRMKRVIAQDNPALLAFDENQWTARLNYHEQSVEDAIELSALMRRQMARALRPLPDAALERSGTHSDGKPRTLRQLIEMSIRHQAHHLKFLIEKRAKLGKPLAGAP